MNKYNNLYEQLERMTELINYNNSFIEDDYLIYEGLIKTTPLKLAKNMLNRMFLSIGYNKNIYHNKFKIGPITMQPEINITKDDTLIVSFLPLKNNINDVKQMLKLINNLGYFIGSINYKEKNEEKGGRLKYSENFLFSLVNQYENLDQFDVELEAKFDIEREIPEKLYHITRQEVLPKIKKIGLSPRSETKLSTHPERIYFGLEYDRTLELVKRFKEQAESKGNPGQKFALLEINTKLVKHIRVFDDPNYKGYGYYILVNVPPNAIKIVKENL